MKMIRHEAVDDNSVGITSGRPAKLGGEYLGYVEVRKQGIPPCDTGRKGHDYLASVKASWEPMFSLANWLLCWFGQCVVPLVLIAQAKACGYASKSVAQIRRLKPAATRRRPWLESPG